MKLFYLGNRANMHYSTGLLIKNPGMETFWRATLESASDLVWQASLLQALRPSFAVPRAGRLASSVSELGRSGDCGETFGPLQFQRFATGSRDRFPGACFHQLTKALAAPLSNNKQRLTTKCEW